MKHFKMCRVLIVLTALWVAVLGAQLRRPLPTIGGRIVGGEDADVKDLPYQLSLLNYGWHICGASIISENWALTAAHCVLGSRASQLYLRAGSNILNEGGSEHRVVKAISHPKFGTHLLDYDYALVQVDPPFPIGQEGVNTIKLSESDPKEGQLAVASGWGALHLGGENTNQLQKVEVPIIGRETCRDMYDDDIGEISERMVCAGLAEGGKDACQGDSGGPLAVDGVLVGIVSWGIGCAYANNPGVYANVGAERDWIREVSGI